MTTVVVCGGRDYHDSHRVFAALDELHSERRFSCLVQGGAAGADWLAGDWARARGVTLAVVNAEWEIHGRAAGPIRNLKMLDEYEPDLVIAFPGGRGTAHMVRIATARGVPVVAVPR